MKIPMAIASAVLLGGVLTACGGSDGDGGGGGGGIGGNGGSGSDYCKDMKAASTSFGDLGAGDAATMADAFAAFHKLASEAPGAIKDDWKTLDGAITTVEKAFESAGLKIEDFDKLASGEMPEGFDPTKLTGLTKEFQKLNGTEFTDASKAIETHAKTVCKVDLNAG